MHLKNLKHTDGFHILKKGGKLIVNTQQMDPMPVIIGSQKYPENISEKISSLVDDATYIDALDGAMKAGTVKAVNTVLIGSFAKISGVDKEIWLEALKETVPAKFLDINIKAFEIGYNS